MNYKNAIKEISNNANKKFPNQITIDLIQEAEELLISEEFWAKMQIQVGALCYRVSIVLEVLNPELEYDKELLTELEASLTQWTEAIESANKSLSIPSEGKSK